MLIIKAIIIIIVRLLWMLYAGVLWYAMVWHSMAWHGHGKHKHKGAVRPPAGLFTRHRPTQQPCTWRWSARDGNSDIILRNNRPRLGVDMPVSRPKHRKMLGRPYAFHPRTYMSYRHLWPNAHLSDASVFIPTPTFPQSQHEDLRWNQTCTDEHMHRRVGTPGNIHSMCLICLECKCHVHGDGNWVSWAYPSLHVFLRVRLVSEARLSHEYRCWLVAWVASPHASQWCNRY